MMGYLDYCSVIWGLYTCKGRGDRVMRGEGKGISYFGPAKAAGVDVIMLESVLGHNGLCTAQLTLDLLASPARGLDSPGLELPVGLGLLDHS